MDIRYCCEYCNTCCKTAKILKTHKKTSCHKNSSIKTQQENDLLKQENDLLKQQLDAYKHELFSLKNKPIIDVDLPNEFNNIGVQNNNNANVNNINNVNNVINYTVIINFLNNKNISPPPLYEISDVKSILIDPIKDKSIYFKDVDDYNTILSEHILGLKDCKTVVSWICNIIKNIYVKDDPKQQQIWNSDITRLTYIVRYTIDNLETWSPDAKGRIINDLIISPILTFISNALKAVPAGILYTKISKYSKYINQIENNVINKLSEIRSNSIFKKIIKTDTPIAKQLLKNNIDSIDKLHDYVRLLQNNKTQILTLDVLTPLMADANLFFNTLIKSVENYSMHTDILRALAPIFKFTTNSLDRQVKLIDLQNTNAKIEQITLSSDDEDDCNDHFANRNYIFLQKNSIAPSFIHESITFNDINYDIIANYDCHLDFITNIISLILNKCVIKEDPIQQNVWNIGSMTPYFVFRLNGKTKIDWCFDQKNRYLDKFIINPILNFFESQHALNKNINDVHIKIDKLMRNNGLYSVICCDVENMLLFSKEKMLNIKH